MCWQQLCPPSIRLEPLAQIAQIAEKHIARIAQKHIARRMIRGQQ